MKQSTRHAQRRDELVAALRRVAGRRGILQANVRAVAAEAEVSAGSVLYYFPTFDDLLLAAVDGVVEEFYERRRRIADAIADPRERLRAMIEAGVPDEISDDLRIVYESIALLPERPQLGPSHRLIVERQVMLYRTAIEIGVGVGAFRPRMQVDAIARNIVALEDAYDLYPLLGLARDRAVVRQAVLDYAGLALDVEL
ncbi:TetR/AcrR family transcriptional regulator [Agromyces marinus]|uniref:TetR family transcriptional regulator n=1 Tax=Agromyces marinus TaxID=1389020 RepID=A0ABN6YE81_9MICO|nr:TetR family transcriptional regulator [Agromyces marinus]UIP57616.1 HTH-type transcriptional regulator BetI [Agromyces marinus]BDZ54230.1 TetR family transcriptional regulator [Agromyces marinus]